jgi:shikimate dehydrogenase
MTQKTTLPPLVDGQTRLFAILGDPIAQVKSPAEVTASLRARARNAVLVPLHVTPDDFAGVVRSLKAVRNLDGLVITVPHKFAAARQCDLLTDRAGFLGAVNVMRRTAAGAWEGDMCDGQGFVDALLRRGGAVSGRRALLLGAGGAGTAIGYQLLVAGVSSLAIHDIDRQRQRDLVAKLGSRFGDCVSAGDADPAGFALIANASPAGMDGTDTAPLALGGLQPGMIVGDVVTASGDTALIAAARTTGCIHASGHDMYRALQETMVDFLLGTA